MQINVNRQYLNLPVKNGAETRLVRLTVDGESVREFDIELAEAEPDFWVFTDVSEFAGRQLVVEAEGVGEEALGAIVHSDGILDGDDLYREELRPQFHFSSRRGWNNDPNGLMYYKGEYHLFYQHNPYGWKWGNMHWGHAVSRDLVHWEELPDALHPDELGTMFSGAGVVDRENTAGFQTGNEEVMVCTYTAAGGRSRQSENQPFTQAIAYSNDRGRTWTKHAGNPVLGHLIGGNRDPKVIWHEPTQRWVMALFLEKHDYSIFTSPDLKSWTRVSDVTLPDCGECPDLFELPVDGDACNTRWVFWGANGTYRIGSFDGKIFLTEGPPERFDWGGNSYAAQTFSDLPSEDGRRIQIAWARVVLPGMPFNQHLTFPTELTLRTTDEGIRLHAEPVREIEEIHGDRHEWSDEVLRPGRNLLFGMEGELFDIRAELEPGGASEFGFVIRGVPVTYDVQEQVLACKDAMAPLEPVDGKIRLQILVDRTFIEIFGNDGRVCLPVAAVLPNGEDSLEVFGKGGNAKVNSLEVFELRSIWG